MLQAKDGEKDPDVWSDTSGETIGTDSGHGGSDLDMNNSLKVNLWLSFNVDSCQMYTGKFHENYKNPYITHITVWICYFLSKRIYTNTDFNIHSFDTKNICKCVIVIFCV